MFSSYNQFSQYVEGQFVYNNTEGYVQDNWKVTNKLTLDYGVRFVHQQPQYDELGQASNFLPEKWTRSSTAPVLYLAGCAAQPCTGANRQALDPRTNTLLGPNTAAAIGTLVPNSGNKTERPVPVGQRHRQDHLHLAGAQAGAALRHGLRPDRAAEHRPARRRRPLLRSAGRQRDLRAGRRTRRRSRT